MRALSIYQTSSSLNRAVRRTVIFDTAEDYDAFVRVVRESLSRFKVKIIAYCLMPNHWHLLLWPRENGDLSTFMKWLSTTHAARWNKAHGLTGRGAVYQSRFKSVPVQEERHLLYVWRYIERNPVNAQMVARAENWRWSSLSSRQNDLHKLDKGPVDLPADWKTLVNVALTNEELKIARCDEESRGQTP